MHRALAEATDPDVDPDRRAWHRGHAASGLDESVASELEHSAGRARARGGIAAAAAFLERAAEMTPDSTHRGRRALAAAQAKFDSGALEAARQLLAMAEACPLDDLQRAVLTRMRAQIVFALRRGADAPPLLLEAARRLEPHEARETFDWQLGDAVARGEGRAIGGIGYFNALLYNSLGRYDAALASARKACEYEDVGHFGFSLVELVEAAARSGADDEATGAFRGLEERTNAVGTEWRSAPRPGHVRC